MSSLDYLGTLVIRAAKSTSDSAPAWVPEPSGRGTYGLISSCVLTLSLCVWTSIHLNTHPEKSTSHSVASRLLYTLRAILSPEYILFGAYDQWLTAKKLKDKVNEIGQRGIMGDLCDNIREAPGKCPCKNPDRHPRQLPSQYTMFLGEHNPKELGARHHVEDKLFKPWTMAQACYAVAGGVAVDLSIFWQYKRLTFTPDGIIELAKVGLLPEIDEKEIEDKSKVDVMARHLLDYKLVVSSSKAWRG